MNIGQGTLNRWTRIKQIYETFVLKPLCFQYLQGRPGVFMYLADDRPGLRAHHASV